MSTLSLTPDNKLKLQCSFLERDLAKKISGAYWDKSSQCWLYSFSKDRVDAFRKYFSDIEISAEALEVEKKEIDYEKKLIELKNLKTVDLDWKFKVKPFDHQKVAINYLLNVNGAMLADDLGLGKSFVCLIVSVIRKLRGEIKKALIICPATVKYSVWAHEVEKFTDEKYIVIDGGKKERIELYKKWLSDDSIFFCIINYELAMIDIDYLKNLPYDSQVTCDESIFIKNNKAKRSKAVKLLKSKYKIAVTGYPIGNYAIDLHSQFDFCKNGLLGSWWSFLDKFCDFHIMKFGNKQFKQLSGYKNLDILKTKIEPYYIRRLKESCLDLPEKIYEEREVRLSGKLLEAYNDMKEEMRTKVLNMKEEEVTAKASTVLTQMLRLSQLTCGFITDQNLENPVFYKENPKIEALDDILDEAMSSNKKVVIWTRFRPFTFYLHKRYNEGFKYNGEMRKYNCCLLMGGMNAKEKDDNIEKFQNQPDYKIIVATIQTGGMGLTLTSGSIEIFTDLSLLSPATIIQAENRCHRISQKNTVVIIKLLARGSIDKHWVKLLEKKQKLSNLIFEDEKDLKLNKDSLLKLLE